MKPILTAKEGAELRERTIEECARVARSFDDFGDNATAVQITAAIRALSAKAYAEAYFEECMALKRELKQQRNATIEQCARVVEENSPAELYPYNPGARIAAAIRDLKDRP